MPPDPPPPSAGGVKSQQSTRDGSSKGGLWTQAHARRNGNTMAATAMDGATEVDGAVATVIDSGTAMQRQ